MVVGEVWIAAGQSNMNHGGPDLDTGVYPPYASPPGPKPAVRLADFGCGASMEPLPDVDPSGRGEAPWAVAAELKPGESASLPRFFARLLRDELNVPVGIVRVAVSGTSQAAWMSKEPLERFPGGARADDFYRQYLAECEAEMAGRSGDIRSWAQFKAAEDQWRAVRKGVWPGRTVGLPLLQYPSVLYNTRIHPLAPFAVRGAIWHQGEAGPRGPYGERLVAMARQWRKAFGQDFFFLWGTLARDTSSSPRIEPGVSYFYRSATNDEIRRARGLFGDDPGAEMVELYDAGNEGTHFGQKAEAGRRMALAALAVAYGRPGVYSGPRVAQIELQGGTARARFTHVGGGLVFQPSIDGISGIVLKSPTGPDCWAKATVLDRETLRIEHPEGRRISGVGYAVSPNPHETLFNREGLPASPFSANLGRLAYDAQAPGTRLVTRAGSPDNLSLPHVRRDGYAFRLAGTAATGGAAKVEAYVSREWDGVEARSGGQPLPAQVVERDGKRFATFDAPAGGAWVIVAAPGKAAAFDTVNRF